MSHACRIIPERANSVSEQWGQEMGVVQGNRVSGKALSAPATGQRQLPSGKDAKREKATAGKEIGKKKSTRANREKGKRGKDKQQLRSPNRGRKEKG